MLVSCRIKTGPDFEIIIPSIKFENLVEFHKNFTHLIEKQERVIKITFDFVRDWEKQILTQQLVFSVR